MIRKLAPATEGLGIESVILRAACRTHGRESSATSCW